MDTSAAHCAVALICGDVVLGSLSEPLTKGQAERLMPMCEDVLAEARKSWVDIERLVVCTGPGNFTGVRIAVSAARGLAVSLGVPAVGVSVFEALAFGTSGRVRVSLDGRREMVFWQGFEDGVSIDEPVQEPVEAVTADYSVNIGFLTATETQVDPVELAKCGALKPIGNSPAPLYLRSADAALPSDPPLRILR